MSYNRRKLKWNTFAVKIGCNCRKPKLDRVFCPKPKTKIANTLPNAHLSESSSTSLRSTVLDKGDSSITFSPKFDYSKSEEDDPKISNERATRGGSSRIGESLAIVKDSEDPYLDFRHSMLQMILEKEIYSRDDLRELLHCFLSLNSPYHHQVIVRAFTEIWNGLFYSSKVT